MPFDRFTIEQLAGDLLPGAGRRRRSPPATTGSCRRPRKAGRRPRNTRPSTRPTACGTRPPPGSARRMGCCPMPRPQIRSLHDEGFLQLRGVLRGREGEADPAAGPDAMPTAEQATAAGAAGRRDRRRGRRRTTRHGRRSSPPRNGSGRRGCGSRRAGPPRCRKSVAAAVKVKRANRTREATQTIKRLLSRSFCGKGPGRRQGRAVGAAESGIPRRYPHNAHHRSRAAAYGAALAPRQLAGRFRARHVAGGARVSRQAGRQGPSNSIGPGPLDGRAGESAGRPRVGQPAVAAALRRGTGADHGRPGHARLAADASGAAGLAGGGAASTAAGT